MKLIHTADIGLDRCFADQALPPHVGQESRAYLRSIVQIILDRAQAWSADGVLIAGNLFDVNRVERDTVSFLREAFAAIAPIPIFISPGSSDPCVLASPYLTELWPENVHIFSKPTVTSMQLGPLTVFGFGHNGPDVALQPFDNFERAESVGPHLVLASARATYLDDPENAAPTTIALESLAHPELAYVALGGHPTVQSVGDSQGVAAWYPGTPAAMHYSATGPHHYLEITIPGAEALRVDTIPVSMGRFFRMTVDCTDLSSGQALIDVIRPHLIAEEDRQCAQIILEGALLPEIYDEMTSVRDVLAENVGYLDLVDHCFVAENFEVLAKLETSLGAFVARITREIDDAPDATRRAALCRSRDLALCAYRGQHLPIRAAQGD